jgi:hypothetical protein
LSSQSDSSADGASRSFTLPSIACNSSPAGASRPLSRQVDTPSNCSVHLWLNRRPSQTMSNRALRGAGRRQTARHCSCAPALCRQLRRCRSLPTLHSSQSPPHAICTVPQTAPLYLVRRPRSRMQSLHRNSPQALRNALDAGRRQQHHRPTVLSSQRAV